MRPTNLSLSIISEVILFKIAYGLNKPRTVRAVHKCIMDLNSKPIWHSVVSSHSVTPDLLEVKVWYATEVLFYSATGNIWPRRHAYLPTVRLLHLDLSGFRAVLSFSKLHLICSLTVQKLPILLLSSVSPLTPVALLSMIQKACSAKTGVMSLKSTYPKLCWFSSSGANISIVFKALPLGRLDWSTFTVHESAV